MNDICENRSNEQPANGPDRSDAPDHLAAAADLLRLYAKRIASGENPADWPEFPLVMRVIARRI